MGLLSWWKTKRKPEPSWLDPEGQEATCPECGAAEHFVVRIGQRARVVHGELVEKPDLRAVVCLACDQPYVIAPHRPGGVMRRRRVAAGVEIQRVPPESRKGDNNGALSILERDLAGGRIMEEP